MYFDANPLAFERSKYIVFPVRGEPESDLNCVILGVHNFEGSLAIFSTPNVFSSFDLTSNYSGPTLH